MALTNGFGRSGLSFVYNSLGINPSVSRQSQEQWQINPVNDSVKLTLMRCVYQHAVAGCYGGMIEAGGCPDCQRLFAGFYPDFLTVTKIEPQKGQWKGGELVTITGTNLGGVTRNAQVTFGGVAVTRIRKSL